MRTGSHGLGCSPVCYNGAANATSPTTRLDLAPAAPDGTNDWYVTKPTLRVESADKETYVAERKVKIGAAEWKTPEDAELLAEGEYGLAAYGVDSRGLRGEEARSYVKIDTTAPTSELTLSAIEPATGWFLSPVTVTLSGTDAVSGLAAIQTSLETAPYTGPIAINTDGVHDVHWHAIDKAGNLEAERKVTVRIDLTPPYAEASVARDRGIAVVTLTASDSGSGVDYVEYSADSAAVTRYAEPLVFLAEGLHQVQYRAVDKAGRIGEWKTAEAFVSKNHGDTRVMALGEAGDEKRKAESPAHERMQLFEPDTRFGRDDDRRDERPWFDRREARVRNLPRYCEGGDYQVWEEKDAASAADPVGTFRVKKAAAVYIFMQSGATAPSGWSAVEKGVRINGKYYPEGADVYFRRYNAGSLVNVPGKRAGTVAPLVIAQELKTLEADLRIAEREGRDDWWDHDLRGEWPDSREGYEQGGDERDDTRHGGAETVSPGEDVTLNARVKPRPYADNLPLVTRYYVESGTGWEELPSSVYSFPWTDGTYAARFKAEVSAPDGVVECTAEAAVTVQNLASFKLESPKPGIVIKPADRVRLEYEAKDAAGRRVSDRDVSVYERINGGAKKVVTGDRWTIKAPTVEGNWELIFEWPVADGKRKTESYAFTVRKRK